MSKLNSVAMSTCLWIIVAVLCAQMLMTRGAALKVKYCSQNDECGAGLYCDTFIEMCDNCKPICENLNRIKDCLRHCKVMYDDKYNTVEPPVQEPTPKAEHAREEPSDAESTGSSSKYMVALWAGLAVVAIAAVVLIIGGIVWWKGRHGQPAPVIAVQASNHGHDTNIYQPVNCSMTMSVQPIQESNAQIDLAMGSAESPFLPGRPKDQ